MITMLSYNNQSINQSINLTLNTNFEPILYSVMSKESE